jgi:hypothetical protein
MNPADVIDEEELVSENESVRSIWKEAISSVSLRMIELQKKEQTEKARADGILPSALELKEMIRKDAKATDEKAMRTNSNSNSSVPKKRKFLHTGEIINSSGESDSLSNPFRRISSHSKTIWRTDLSTLTKEQRDAELVEMKEKLEREKSGEADDVDDSSATPCPSCGSLRTTTQLLGSYDISKCETWGSKDATSAVMRIQCRECRYVGNATEGFSYLS